MLFIMSDRTLKTFLPPFVALALILAIGVVGLAQPSPSTSSASSAPEKASSAPSVDAIIEMILNRNRGLASYQAHARLDIRQVNFPYLHPVLNGTEYFNSPGYTVFDFPHTPSYLKGITKVEGAVGLATRWRHCYDITVDTQPDAYLLHMIPKIRGEVTELDVTVAKNGGELEHFDWYYRHDGDRTSLTQYYTVVGGYSVVTLQQSDIHLHHIRAKLTGTFDTFQYNVPAPTPTPTPSDPLHQCDN